MTRAIYKLVQIAITTCFLTCSLSIPMANATIEGRPLPTDQRLKIITYQPNQVIKFVGHYEYLSSIVFEEDETVKTLLMGNSTLWDIVRSNNRLFLKPIDENATTNMTVITNKRLYQFELHAEEVDEEKGISDESLSFELRFVYPSKSNNNGIVAKFSRQSGPDLSKPENYNFNYTISGSQSIAPIKIFDDGEFTYFQFANRNAEIPAFFLVKPDGSEAIVNYRVMGNYIVVERVSSQFTLRNGSDVVCAFNETMPLPKVVE